MISKTQRAIVIEHAATGRRAFIARGGSQPVRILVRHELVRFVDGGRVTILTPRGRAILHSLQACSEAAL